METVTQPAPAAEVKPAPAQLPEAAPVVEQEPKPERTFSQAELDAIVEKRVGKEKRKRDDVERRLKITEELHLKSREQERPKEPAPQAKGEPVRGDYGTYEEFLEARAEFRADLKVDQKFKERETQDRERSAQSEQEKAREKFRQQMKDSAKDIEDFDEVIAEIKATDPVGKLAASAIDAADAPGRILHYLAKNPDEAERIASLSPGKQAREVVKLEEKLSKPPVKASKAPEPIKPVGGKSTVGDEMPDATKEPEKWLKWRNGQIAERKRLGVRA